MTIPPARLAEMLVPFDGLLGLRTAENLAKAQIPYTEAFALAIRGQIEGVASHGGRIRFLRELPESQRPKLAPTEELADESSSTAFAHLNMGAFREPVISVGEVIGYVWQLRRQPATVRHAQ